MQAEEILTSKWNSERLEDASQTLMNWSISQEEKEKLLLLLKECDAKQKENENLKDALEWVTEQFEKVLAKEVAGNVVESLSFAKHLLRKIEERSSVN